MNVLEAIRDSVTARQAAEKYGIEVNRNGMAVCPLLQCQPDDLEAWLCPND